MRVETAARALAGPIASRCLATNSSDVILSVVDNPGLLKQSVSRPMARRLVTANFLCSRCWVLFNMTSRSWPSLKILCASSVDSVSQWLVFAEVGSPQRHRDPENTETAQRKLKTGHHGLRMSA